MCGFSLLSDSFKSWDLTDKICVGFSIVLLMRERKVVIKISSLLRHLIRHSLIVAGPGLCLDHNNTGRLLCISYVGVSG